MAFYDIGLLAQDSDFALRVTASYTVETLATPGAENGNAWASSHAWELAAQPGFGDAYAYALAADNPNPGRDPAVITDGQILSAVQAVVAAGSTA